MISGQEFIQIPRFCVSHGGLDDPEILRKSLNGHKKVYLVVDPWLVRSGRVSSLQESLQRLEIRTAVYDRILSDPPEELVIEAADIARDFGATAVLGIGGGSAMDVAKVVALLADPECSQTLPELYGVENAIRKGLFLIQIPTTAGTGSEATAVAIFTRPGDIKSGVVSRHLMADFVLLDAGLTAAVPREITIHTGIDAMVHAIEAYTSRLRKNPVSDALAVQALSLLWNNLPVVLRNPADISAREAMLIGAHMAGSAFANAPVAAVHALAYPLGGLYHLSHGLSNSLVLLPVLRFNEPAAAECYRQLCRIIAPQEQASAGEFIRLFAEMLHLFLNSTELRDYGVPQDAIPTLADQAMLQTRLLVNNPREVTREDALEIYSSAWSTG